MKRFSFFNKMMLPILLMVFSGVTINLCCLKLGYAIEKTKKETSRIKTENNYLAKQIALYCSPKNLEAYASATGLKYPEPYSIVILDEALKKKERGRKWFASIFKSSDKS
ncbi:MAG: hypothetical protein Fur0012_01750 [Elusimicrobiota bacterium]